MHIAPALPEPIFTGLNNRSPNALWWPFLFSPSDLVGMYAHENFVNLTRYALPLEDFVRKEEEQSARLEATLLPQYSANGERGWSFPLNTRCILGASAMFKGGGGGIAVVDAECLDNSLGAAPGSL